jgi:hypothetical protein
VQLGGKLRIDRGRSRLPGPERFKGRQWGPRESELVEHAPERQAGDERQMLEQLALD